MHSLIELSPIVSDQKRPKSSSKTNFYRLHYFVHIPSVVIIADNFYQVNNFTITPSPFLALSEGFETLNPLLYILVILEKISGS